MLDIKIPEKLRATIPGFEPIFFYPSDFVSTRSRSAEQCWTMLCKGSPYLKRENFKDEKTFHKYFLISCDLTEGTMIVNGKERSGKSLFIYHLAYQRKELFGIPAVFNRRPKKGFGEYRSIPDNELKQMQDDLNKLVAEIEALKIDDDEPLPDELQERLSALKCYGVSYNVDESYKEVSKDHITNRTRFYGQLVRQHGHLHTLFSFVSPDPNDIALRLVFERKTHQVFCKFSHGKCYYTIFVNTIRVPRLVKTMELVPSNWGFLWNSTNLVGTETLRFNT